MPGEANQLSAHDAAMIQKVDEASAAIQSQVASPMGGTADPAPAPADTKPARPENVPEQFWDAEKGAVNTDALLKSYAELQAAKAAPEAKSEEAKPGDGKTAEEAVAAAKLDMATLQAEFAAEGKLSDASMAALEKAGFGRDVVDSYIAGQVALAQVAQQEAFGLVGGEAQYGQMLTWAQSALSPAEVEAFNAAVVNPAARKQAILGLKAQMEAAVGRDPRLVSGATQGAGNEGPFASRAEAVAAMKDARYRTDPAYRASVERRVGLMDNF